MFASYTPLGLDLPAMMEERERRIQNQIHYRVQELSNLPANINQELKLKAAIELKMLRLLPLQKKV